MNVNIGCVDLAKPTTARDVGHRSAPKTHAQAKFRFSGCEGFNDWGARTGSRFLMKEELAGHQVSQIDILEELIVRAVGIEHLIMMSGVEEIVKLLH